MALPARMHILAELTAKLTHVFPQNRVAASVAEWSEAVVESMQPADFAVPL